MIPISPLSPFGPVAPISPLSPFGPCGPIGPAGPGGQVQLQDGGGGVQAPTVYNDTIKVIINTTMIARNTFFAFVLSPPYQSFIEIL